MAKTLEEVRNAAMDLPDPDRQRLAEELMSGRWRPGWREAWAAEAERRYDRIKSGEDRTLTLDEFWSDNPPE
jgi:hypothetical protein